MIELKLDENELNAAISTHLKAKIPTVDTSTVKINIVAARQDRGSYADVSFEFEDENSKKQVSTSQVTNRTVAPTAVRESAPVSEPVEETQVLVTGRGEEVQLELETTPEEDAADDAAAEEEEVAETKPAKKKLFGANI